MPLTAELLRISCTLKMSLIPKLHYEFNTIPIKILKEISQANSKVNMGE